MNTVLTESQTKAWEIIQKHEGFFDNYEMSFKHDIRRFTLIQLEELGLIRRVLKNVPGTEIYLKA